MNKTTLEERFWNFINDNYIVLREWQEQWLKWFIESELELARREGREEMRKECIDIVEEIVDDEHDRYSAKGFISKLQ